MTGCQTCGTAAAPDARFCSHCGARLGDESTSVDPAIRERVLTTLRAEHRLVTVVFADMTGSVSRTRHLDAEGATELVNPLLQTMVELMVQHGGRIDRFLGDGVLAVFGVPEAHEDDPIRAIRAAIELRERASELGLDVTVGVNTGRVYFGPVGSSLHEELTVMGSVVNLAARLQGTARPGEVIVGESTRAHIHAAFDLESRTLQIKGVDEPVEAFAVTRLSANPDKVRGIEGLTSRLVGRDDELRRLVEAIADGRPVAVIGDAGIGKSRLFREARGATAATWILGRCQDLTSTVPFSGFIDLLGRHLGDTTPNLLEASLVNLPSLSESDRGEILPFLVHMTGHTLGDGRDRLVMDSDAALRARLTIEAIRRWLTAVAEHRSVIVLIDDLHWADSLTVDALSALARDEYGVTVAVASRPEPSTAIESFVGNRLDLERIRLSELDSEQTRELTRHLLEISGLPPETESQLIEWSRGNPFYVEELLRSLIQREMIVDRDGHWGPGPVPIALELPESIDGLIMSRYDRLPTATRRVGQVAGVLDRPFEDGLLGAVVSFDAGSQLDELTEAGFLKWTGSSRAFTHDLVREAIYRSLLPSQQLELHERIGEVMRSVAPDDHEALAHHFERSSNHQAAVEELLAAAKRSFDAYANDTAARFVERGLSGTAQLGPEQRNRWTVRYLLLRAQLLERASDYTEALVDLAAARNMAATDDHLFLVELLLTTARVHRMRDEYDEAFAALDEADAVTEPNMNPGTWIELQEERAQAMYFGGRGRELPELIEALRPVVEAHGSEAQRADLIGQTVFHRFITERFRLTEETVDLCRQALDLAAGADPERLATARFRQGFCLLWADRSAEALPHLERALAMARRIGDAMLENRAASYRAIAHRRIGRVEEAHAAAEAARSVATKVGDPYYVGHAEAVLGWATWQLGDSEAASRHLHAALDAWGPSEHEGVKGVGVEFAWLAAWPLAAISLERGEFDSAVDHLRLLTVPWERPMPDDLREAVAEIDADSNRRALRDAMDLARTYRLV